MKIKIVSEIDVYDLPSYNGFSGADEVFYFLDDLFKVGIVKLFEEHISDRLLIERDYNESGADGAKAHRLISQMLKEDVRLCEKIAHNLKVEIC